MSRANDLVHVCTDTHSTPNGTLQLGLTIREHFAAMAMQGLCANAPVTKSGSGTGVAKTAVEIADALIAELAKVRP